MSSNEMWDIFVVGVQYGVGFVLGVLAMAFFFRFLAWINNTLYDIRRQKEKTQELAKELQELQQEIKAIKAKLGAKNEKSGF